MVSFAFKVNESFLKYPNHPITVPKATYGQLEKENLSDSHLLVICPDGTNAGGDMYSGNAGYGFYYQIRFSISSSSHALNSLRIGQNLIVEIQRTEPRVIVRLRVV